MDELCQFRWLARPPFLYTSQEHTPEYYPISTEVKMTCLSTAVDSEKTDVTLSEMVRQFSTLSRAKRCLATLLQRLPPNRDQSKPQILKKAETVLIKWCQRKQFADEVHDISRNKPLHRSSAIHKLNHFLDEKGVLRVGGRLGKSNLNYELKHPVILPKEDHLTQLMIQHCHQRVGHGRKSTTINELRSSGYLIVGCTSRVNSSIYH